MAARSDGEKQAEQLTLSMEYQRSVNRKRQSRDGVVVTPIEVVDFQLRSILGLLKQQNREPEVGVEWLDPFAGTGIYTARLLQIVDLSPERKCALADNCVVVEIDPDAAQVCFDNLARVYREETGKDGFVRVISTDTFSLDSDYDLWADNYGYRGVVHIPAIN